MLNFIEFSAHIYNVQYQGRSQNLYSEGGPSGSQGGQAKCKNISIFDVYSIKENIFKIVLNKIKI